MPERDPADLSTSFSVSLPNASDVGVVAAIQANKPPVRINSHHRDLQVLIEDAREDYLAIDSAIINGVRHDYRRFGVLAEVLARTQVFVYDLPQLGNLCDTAFVDRSGKMYVWCDFARRLLHEHQANSFSLFFVFGHEMSHLVRLHLSRMLDFPADISNRAQDARNNIDLVTAEVSARIEERLGALGTKSRGQFHEAEARKLLNELASTSVGSGVAMTWEKQELYRDLSEEGIAALMMQDYVPPAPIQNRDISFPLLMEAAAGEVDEVKQILRSGIALPPSPKTAEFTPAELSSLSTLLRHIGANRARPEHVSTAELEEAHQGLHRLLQHQGMLELNLRHERASIGKAGGAVHASGKSGDPYLDILKPKERIELAIKILDQVLRPAPANGMPAKPQESGVSIKDLERSMGRGQGEQQPSRGGSAEQSAPDQDGAPDRSEPATGAAGGPTAEPGQTQGTPSRSAKQGVDMVPSPLTHSSDSHVIDPETVAEVLRSAGVSEESIERLGYKDLATIQGEVQAAKEGMVAAVNKASADQVALGERFPGGHILHYAKAQLKSLDKPQLSWQMTLKKFQVEAGRGVHFDDMEAWTTYYVHHGDMGLGSDGDIPFLGSEIPGKPVRPLLFNLHDLSGSVRDAEIRKHISEAVQAGRAHGGNQGMDSVHLWADTLVRDEPLFITERNYQQVLSGGVTYAGRGGTNLQATLEHLFELVSARPGQKRTPFTGRNIDAIVNWGDLGDAPPDPVKLLAKAKECGLKRLPPILFIAPRHCYNDRFTREAGTWCNVVYYDALTPQTINIDQMAVEQAAKAPGWMSRPASTPAPGKR